MLEPQSIRIAPLTREHAEDIATWRYDAPYDVYDMVGSDPIAPTVIISAPAAGVVSGTIAINAAASDNVRVMGVQFMLDGAPFGAEVMAAPYSVSWNTEGA